MRHESRAHILRARAKALAQRQSASLGAAPQIDVLLFDVGKERYAMEMHHVREVQAVGPVTPLSGTPAFVRGLVNVRGRVVTLLDLAVFFGLPAQDPIPQQLVIIVEHVGHVIGISTGPTVSTSRLPSAEAFPHTETSCSGTCAAIVRETTADRVNLLDMKRLLTDPRLVVDDRTPGLR